jgi:citrate lyase subunit beta / citryl-CoA lyase
MIDEQQLLEKVQHFFEQRDIKELDALVVAKARKLNKKQDFRSALMLSANNFKHLMKIPDLSADAIILNLEDGVSKEDKPFALMLCALFLSLYKESDKKLIVRVNSLDTGGYDEITYLNRFMPDAIRVPKIRTQEEVKNILHLLNEPIELHLSIETAEAWANMQTLAVDKRVTTFYLGALDLFADMGLPQSLIKRENPTFLYMLSHFLITCKSLYIKPVSFVYQEFAKLDEFEKWLLLEQEMGYKAKGCISPKQADAANRIFVDAQAQIERAHTIVKLFEMNRDLGISGFTDEEYGFIDEPVYKDALNILKNISN